MAMATTNLHRELAAIEFTLRRENNTSKRQALRQRKKELNRLLRDQREEIVGDDYEY